jgi:uncharacterized protein YndB with AHSA1/START domain
MSEDLDPAAVSGTSSEAVAKATGKPWSEWMALLDAAGGRKMTHKQIVACLVAEHDASPWWRQQIAVAYEQSRGLREKHEMSDGYQISRSRTMAVDAERIYNAWLDDGTRRRWLPGDFTVRKATPYKTLRLTWSDGSRVEVRLDAKGPEKCAVVVQHDKLPDADAAERMKEYWADALERLRELVEA